MNLRIFATAGLCAVAIAAPAFAATTTYDDRATFNANATISNTATFDGAVLPGFDGIYFGDVGGSEGVIFAGADAEITIVRGGASGLHLAGNAYGSDYLRWESALLTVSFLDPVIAVGFDFMDLTGRPTTFTFDIGGAPSAGSLIPHTVGGGPRPLDLATFSERARKDPQLMTMVQDLAELQVKRRQLES